MYIYVTDSCSSVLSLTSAIFHEVLQSKYFLLPYLKYTFLHNDLYVLYLSYKPNLWKNAITSLFIGQSHGAMFYIKF